MKKTFCTVFVFVLAATDFLHAQDESVKSIESRLRNIDPNISERSSYTIRGTIRGIVESRVLLRVRKVAYPVDDFTLQRPDAGTRIRHETDYDSHSRSTSRRSCRR